MPSYLTGCTFHVPASFFPCAATIRAAANKFEPFPPLDDATTGFEFGLLISHRPRAVEKMHHDVLWGIFFRVYIAHRPMGIRDCCRRNGALSRLPLLGRSANFHPQPAASALSRESINLSSRLPSSRMRGKGEKERWRNIVRNPAGPSNRKRSDNFEQRSSGIHY